MKPTKSNKTKVATAYDIVYTKDETAKWIVDYFNPNGDVLDSSAGKDAFYKHFNVINKYCCEISDGIDFF